MVRPMCYKKLPDYNIMDVLRGSQPGVHVPKGDMLFNVTITDNMWSNEAIRNQK